MEVLEAQNKGEADLKLKSLGCNSHIWKKKTKTNDKTHGNLTFLNHRNMKDMSGASLKQKLSPSSIPNKDLLPLDQNQPLEKKKGDHVQEMTVPTGQQ